MEILIPGLILVALMVYASTKIKRNAAAAYAEEKIDTTEFAVTKPEDFISPADSDLAFAAYSKNFGADEADAIRQVSAELTIYENKNLDQLRSMIANRASKVNEEQRVGDGGIVVETEEIENGISIDCEYRVYEKPGKIFVLAIKVLPESKSEHQKNIDTLLSSFEVK